MTCEDPVTEPITLYKGETTVMRITVIREDDGLRENLTTASNIEWQLKTAPGAADAPLISKSLGSGVVLLTQSGDTLGQFEVTLLSADTSALAAGVYYYDAVVVMPGAVRHYVIRPSKATIKDVVNGA